MKKVLVLLVAVAVALSLAGVASAKNVSKTKDKGEVTTPTDTATFKTITINKGKFTTEKGKVVDASNPNLDPSQGIRVETLKFKQYHDNAVSDGDYMTLVNDRNETVRPVMKDAKVDHLKNASDKKVTVYSSYNILDAGWQVIQAEVLD